MDPTRLLLTLGASPNLQDKHYHNTALHWATAVGNTAAVSTLLTHGADSFIENSRVSVFVVKHYDTSCKSAIKCLRFGKNVEPNSQLCTMSKKCVLADDKMANTSLDVHTFIAHYLPKYCFQSSLDYAFLSLRMSSVIFSRKICDICHIWIRKVAVVFYSLSRDFWAAWRKDVNQ